MGQVNFLVYLVGTLFCQNSLPVISLEHYVCLSTGSENQGKVVEQTDIAPTLSILLGVPIPQNSLGTVITQALGGLDMRHKLQASYVNGQQILKVLQENVPSYTEGKNSW